MQGRGLFKRRALVLAALTLALLTTFSLNASAIDLQWAQVSVGQINGNGDFDATWGGVSSDGLHDFFETQEQLTTSDTDTQYDVYERFNNSTTHVSVGAINGNGAFKADFVGNSDDGLHVYFQTAEKLVSADTDSVIDVYERFNGQTTLVSQGTGNFNTATESFFLDASPDGSKVLFSSYDQLAANDTDGSFRDVYMRSGGVSTLISTGPQNANGPFGSDFDGMTPDASHVYFHTDAQLSTSDTDSTRDIYDASGGSSTLVSTGPTGGNGGQVPIWQGATPDGAHVYFQTTESLTATDTDTFLDVYDRSGGTTAEESLGPNGGNGAWDASFAGASDDGTKVWFSTRESIVAGDSDGGCEDSLGNPTLQCLDVYERTPTGTSWVSIGGNGAFEASFAAASQNGSKVFFHTQESISPSDNDANSQDVYERSGGVTTQISVGPVGGTGAHTSDLVGISSDGARVIFHTYESLVSADNDGNWQDVYERYAGETTLISTGPAANNSASIAFYHGSTADGTKIFFQTDEHLVTADTDASEDIYAATQVPIGHVRPKGATPATIALIPAFAPCVTPNNTHGAPFAYGSCSPPTQDSGVLTIGSPDANGRAASATSQVKFKVLPSSPENVQMFIKVNDVLCRAANAACPGGALSDFAGMVLVRFSVRITDKYNGSPPVESGTLEDLTIDVPVQCAATPASTSTGGACQTTLNITSLYPGLVADQKRAIWQLDNIKVMDPGPNGSGFGAGCPGSCGDGDETVFLRPGVFTP